jgi:hypothetical protein
MYEYRYGVGRITKEEKEVGYVDTFTKTYQVFYVDKYIKKGFFESKIGRKVLYHEEIPQAVLIEKAILGSTEWRYSCPEDIFRKCSEKVVERK